MITKRRVETYPARQIIPVKLFSTCSRIQIAMNYRNLSNDEISILKKNNCQADNWDHIQVSQNFQPDRVQNVYFSGENTLGVFDGTIEVKEGETVRCGIYNTTLRDTVIEDNVFIASVQFLSRYHVETGAIIRNVGTIRISGETTFGNGLEISVLNEGGGREIFMYDRMNAQIAAIMATCRHDTRIPDQLKSMIRQYAEEKKSERGWIGSGAEIRDSGELKNVHVGEYTRINNAVRLEECTLAGSKEDQVQIGAGVIASNVIVQSGSVVESGALLEDCFVGQGVKIGKQFSAENSAFFANSEAYHGEAVSLFAGPYTVTHHKSTLLIACMTSFINVGSGTNQSNHMYKLGPVHQGVMERGVKTGSFSYMAWPSYIGPFTAVIDKHTGHFDSSEFPFSYINQTEGRSVLTPAMNLFTVGTLRDSAKWADRDRRKDPEQFDWIHFDLFNPYLIGKVLKAKEAMVKLQESASEEQRFVHYKGLNIKRVLLKTCSRYYDMAVKIFMGHGLLKRLRGTDLSGNFREIIQKLQYTPSTRCEDWVDLSGMYIPTELFQQLLEDVAAGTFQTPEALRKKLSEIYDSYEEYAWASCAHLIEQQHNVPVEKWDAELLVRVIDEWKNQKIKFNNMINSDAKKEFDSNSRISYGVFGHNEEDFQTVRGETDENKFVKSLKQDNEEVEAEAEKIIKQLQQEAG